MKDAGCWGTLNSGGPIVRRRARFVIALPFVMLSTALLDGQAVHGTVQGNTPQWLEQYREPAARLIGEAVSDTFAWRRLALLTDRVGPRLSGSPQLERAVEWAMEEMKRDGLENVRTELVMVPKWVRGRESAETVEPTRQPIVMLGLGGSIATAPDGVQAELLIVRDFDELDAQAARARGRIVLLNVKFTNYEETVRFRVAGPSRVARTGAVAMLIRSIGPDGLRLPHTGVLQYSNDTQKIPAAAIASEDADRLQR